MFLRILLKNQLAPNPTKSGLFAALNLPNGTLLPSILQFIPRAAEAAWGSFGSIAESRQSIALAQQQGVAQSLARAGGGAQRFLGLGIPQLYRMRVPFHTMRPPPTHTDVTGPSACPVPCR
jgi:hypothetical protein